METSAGALPWQSIYKLMTGAIVPRPIGWISTVDADGTPNLAPFSYFTAVCSNPPTVLFCSSVRASDKGRKDTLNNVLATGEFVVNIVSEALAEAMNLTSGEYPPDVDEFALAGLAMMPSVVVKPPRVAASPVHFECRVEQVLAISEEPGGGSIVIGRVLHIHVADAVLLGTDKIDNAALQAVGRLAGMAYTRSQDTFELQRPTSTLNAG